MGVKRMKIGFIGLGNMGAPMASNLAQTGHEVYGYDIAAQPPESVRRCTSLDEVIRDRDIVFTMLPSGESVREVSADIITLMESQKTFVDCSTVEYSVAQDVAQQAQTHQINFLDAPVSGGSIGATNGTLTFMVGGALDTFNATKPLFEIMGSKVVHCGAVGSGQIAKICNNMIVGATMIATCEAYGLASNLGLDLNILHEVISQSSGFSWTNNVYCPVPGIGPSSPADNDYEPGFAIQLMLKDLKLAQSAAHSVKLDAVLAAKATEYYQLLSDSGLAEKDFSAVMLRFLNSSD